MQLKEKLDHHDIPGRPWEVIEADMFTLKSKNYLCIVAYHIKFSIVKKAEDMVCRQLNTNIQSYFFRILIAKENTFRCRWQFYFSQIQAVLQKYEHIASYVITPSS